LPFNVSNGQSTSRTLLLMTFRFSLVNLQFVTALIQDSTSSLYIRRH